MISPRAPVIGLPTFRLSSWASSSVFSLTSAANFASVRPRLPADHFEPFGRRRPPGGLDRAVDVGLPAQRHVGDDLAGGRVDDLEGLAVDRIDLLAADDHLGPDRPSSEARSRVACSSDVMASPRGCSGRLIRGRRRSAASTRALGRHDGRPDDARVVAQFGRARPRSSRSAAGCTCRALADPAAHDHQRPLSCWMRSRCSSRSVAHAFHDSPRLTRATAADRRSAARPRISI